jgi:hypothetical protein
MPTQLVVVLALIQAAPPPAPPQDRARSAEDAVSPDPAWKSLGAGLWFDPQGRRLIVVARVVLREGALEHLLCLKGTKEHEAILATEAAPIQIQAGLLATGARKGAPVQFLPKFVPPSGSPISVELRWRQDGKTRHADARDWIRDERAKATLKTDWVFAGSELIDDPTSKKPVFAADDGDLITVANFSSAILDLPLASTASDADRIFTANTAALPPRGTAVLMILTPKKNPEELPKSN